MAVNETLTEGGTLSATLTGTPVGGEVFNLFAAGNFSGAFTNFILPALPSGLSWNTDNLASAGTLVIAGSSAPTLGYSQSGGVFTFTWSGSYKLQAQTNPLTVGISTNWSDYPGGGSSGVTVTITNNPAVFFRLKSLP